MKKQRPPDLDSIARIWLKPTAELLGRASTEIEESLAASTLLECCSWVEFGLSVELFPPSAAEELLGYYFGDCSPGFDALKNRGIWAEERIEALRAAMSGSRRFMPESATHTFANPSAMRKRVQTAMLVAANLAFDQSAQAFISALLFANDDRWTRLLAKKLTGDELFRPLSGVIDIWLDGHGFLVYAGLVRTIDQIEAFLFTFESALATYGSEADDWFAFRRSLVAAHAWRLRPRTPGSQKRFKELLTNADEAIIRSLATTNLKADGPNQFESYAEEILQRWIMATEPRTQGA